MIKPYGLGHGSRSRPGLTSRDFQDLGACLRHHTSDQAYGLVGHSEYISARVSFDSSASHSFIVASCVEDFSLEVKTLEKPLHVSSPLGARLSVDQIC